MSLNLDVLRKALHAKKHPGISESSGLVKLAQQGLPYLTSPGGKARPPMTLYWNVNSVCNLRCKMCDVGMFNENSNFFKNLRVDRKLHEIDPELFCRVIDEVTPFKTMIAINGTEPIMYKPLGEVVTYATRKGLNVAVTTGGYTLPARAEELAQAGLARLNVSIDGAPGLHDQIRGRSGAYERVTEGLIKFRQAAQRRGYQPEILINSTIMTMNYNRLVEFYEAVKSLPFDRINFFYMSFVTEEMALAHNLEWGHRYKATVNCLSDEVQPNMIDVDVLYSQLVELQQKKDPRLSIIPFLTPEKLRTYFFKPMQFMTGLPCMSSWFIAQIMANGEVIPYTRCYHVPLGNINEEPFLQLWNGEKAKAWRQDLRKQGRFPGCSRCDLVC